MRSVLLAVESAHNWLVCAVTVMSDTVLTLIPAQRPPHTAKPVRQESALSVYRNTYLAVTLAIPFAQEIVTCAQEATATAVGRATSSTPTPARPLAPPLAKAAQLQ